MSATTAAVNESLSSKLFVWVCQDQHSLSCLWSSQKQFMGYCKITKGVTSSLEVLVIPVWGSRCTNIGTWQKKKKTCHIERLVKKVALILFPGGSMSEAKSRPIFRQETGSSSYSMLLPSSTSTAYATAVNTVLAKRCSLNGIPDPSFWLRFESLLQNFLHWTQCPSWVIVRITIWVILDLRNDNW